ncbi:uncharacterized protein RHOBADRAFT_43103 [Rhodotorula graminis WP1]|uniref:Protein N-terminal glutamine amidohydrolase n=1 Tax=Rhodotorula graminis (strain WP1) TaxID=578459 RepID=A0A194S8F1_RHOGW|nr:uncharacterized protein RHOBADRAFT_43103 [Rhodotorula graminis WP1]KPV75681.1 hypothetical protein RHOBADRAFT_43103 [Rhodotorula graminis WP1]
MAAQPVDEAHYTPFYCEENVYQLLATLQGSPRFSRSFAVFVSNLDRHALLFQQQASHQGPDQGHYVVWDYHVVAVAMERAGGEPQQVAPERVVVLDRDSRLGAVVPMREYVAQTFRPDLFRDGVLEPTLRSRFRVVPGKTFLESFASDRSHMLVPPSTAADAAPLPSTRIPRPDSPARPAQPQYLKPVPPYPPICGSAAAACGETHNLWTRFLDMRLPGERERGASRGLADDEGRYGRVLEGANELLAYPW